ncbi:MAG: hypothetical protein R2712_21410 [Vicinamibacterales bacterium]
MLLALIASTVLLQAGQAAAPATPPPRPDCSAAEHRQFDVWVGDWDVVPNNAPPQPGRKPARNTVTSSHDGCVVHEHWDAPGSTGESFNIYDRTRGQWHQTWVDNTGGLHDYWGRREGANMVFEGPRPRPRTPRFASTCGSPSSTSAAARCASSPSASTPTGRGA